MKCRTCKGRRMVGRRREVPDMIPCIGYETCPRCHGSGEDPEPAPPRDQPDGPLVMVVLVDRGALG